MEAAGEGARSPERPGDSNSRDDASGLRGDDVVSGGAAGVGRAARARPWCSGDRADIMCTPGARPACD